MILPLALGSVLQRPREQRAALRDLAEDVATEGGVLGEEPAYPALAARVGRLRPAPLQPAHERQLLQCAVERLVERGGRADARLAVERLDQQRAGSTVRLQVGATDDPVAPEEGQDVVAVDPLWLGLVHLDQMVEAEHAAGERAIPQQI